MPAPWPSGQATLTNVLNGDTNQQVQAVWLYLSDGAKAATPTGLVRERMELKPQTEPIVYRNFIEGAGVRAIGVGYPEGVNLAFDADNLRLAMIWHGAFMDASRHWTGRGQGFEPPLGDDVIPLPGQVPFFTLEQPDQLVPTRSGKDTGYRFLGYRLDDQLQPIFRYSLHEVLVEDVSVPVRESTGTPTLNRTLRMEGKADTRRLWFRAVVADQLEKIGDHQYRVDNVWLMEARATGLESPRIRDSAGKKELLIPVRLQDGKSEINLRYIW